MVSGMTRPRIGRSGGKFGDTDYNETPAGTGSRTEQWGSRRLWFAWSVQDISEGRETRHATNALQSGGGQHVSNSELWSVIDVGDG